MSRFSALLRSRALFLALSLSCAPAGAQDGAAPVGDPPGSLPEALPRSLLVAWLKDDDGEHPSFLAVIDVDAASPAYGSLLTTASTGQPLTDAHHIPHHLPANGRVFANAFRDGQTFIFDTTTPQLPRLVANFETIDGYSYPHSFAELDNGNFLVTFQTSGPDNDRPGGLIELTPDGDAVRDAPGADSAVSFIRPYSLEVFTELDRVVSTSTDMFGTGATWHLQHWRLSDLQRLGTFALPEGGRRNIHQLPLEVRPVGDGRSAYVSTWNCGLYHLTGIAGRSLSARLVWDFNSQACAIPLRVGNYWFQAVGEAFQIVVLDISDPAAPQLATVVQFPDGFQPHWIAAEPGGRRIVVTGYRAFADRIVIMDWDPNEQNLRVDRTFGEPLDSLPGFWTGRTIWPHGKTGPATAHGVVFWPAGARP